MIDDDWYCPICEGVYPSSVLSCRCDEREKAEDDAEDDATPPYGDMGKDGF